MMLNQRMNPKFNFLLKVVATLLITAALIAEVVNIYRQLHEEHIPNSFLPFFWLGRLALIAHFIEGVIAAVYTYRQQKNFWFYGIYIFFVGTVGLWELWEQKELT